MRSYVLTGSAPAFEPVEVVCCLKGRLAVALPITQERISQSLSDHTKFVRVVRNSDVIPNEREGPIDG
jgi:hypothetical protein